MKIDKSFVDEIEKPKHHSMMKAIIDLCLTLNLNVIAEGIETPRQRAILLQNNCRLGQGYLFSKPFPGEILEALLQQGGENQLKSLSS
ncbi:EAL domain-containing protein [Planococcus sp. ISL-109]|uniref:EAL domain-containing protein n=1 Tax=Planococcus sp. ISL-109 TaxID=2819166 RepID=UPI001BE80789|nr:EAL domain-containing protein [Planococcus sp. ISL-109]